MGLWIVQGCRKSWASRGLDYNYQELMELAASEPSFRILFDPDDESLLCPEDMVTAIDRCCEKRGQPHAPSPGAYVRGALESLAFKYRTVIENLETLTGRRIEQIRVIGGGAKNGLLNQMTADATGKRVVTGPTEAAALGNVAMQMVATGVVDSLREARAAIERSFASEVYEPRETDHWDRQAERFRQYCGRSLCLQ
jgi:rhamnulokinase